MTTGSAWFRGFEQNEQTAVRLCGARFAGVALLLLGASQLSCGQKQDAVESTVSELASVADCQAVSDEFGVTAGVGFGFAPSEIQSWWTQNSCSTSPTTSTDLCQKASDIYGITAGVTWGYAPSSVQTWWTSHSCNRSPLVSENLCRRASDTYGIVANVTWGTAPSYVQTWWVSNACTTAPHSTDACQVAADLYGIVANQSWGFAPTEAQTWWTATGCTARTTTSSTQLCLNAANLYALPQGGSGVPATATNWWNSAGCQAAPSCQGISETFGATYQVTWGYAGSPASPVPTYIQNWWTQHSCTTRPLFSNDTCQRASNMFAITAGVRFASTPTFVQNWWTGSSCNASPNPMRLPNTNAMTNTTTRTLAAAPSNFVITGIGHKQSDGWPIGPFLQWKDNNMPNYYPTHWVWEVFNGTSYRRQPLFSFLTGAPGGIVTDDVPITDFANQTNPCIKMQDCDNNGCSMFSNVYCWGGGTGGLPSSAIVGLGNGVLLTDPAGDNEIFMPTLGEQFKIAWSVCNAGNVAAGALTITLKTTDNNGTVTNTSFNLSSLAAGACQPQSTGLLSVSSSGHWNWEVDISGSFAGGLGFDFF